ncbi:MAG: dipeptidase [Chloroflexi bacterium]|nr:dipeptidase [Chloroflexota bacterium]MCL5274251.1 dipeptidase [Chloroflexota bacterium]
MSDLVIAYAQQQREKYLNDLIEYLAIPSVSAQPQHKQDVNRAAAWLCDHLRVIGMEARVMETGGHPVVYAEWLSAGANRPTVLVYGHYDVQPAEPLDLWRSDPFAAVIRDGVIYGRGSSDNKGQHMAHIKAVESFLAQKTPLPVNVKFLIEGEEEIGGPHLGAFIAANKQLLACDVIMISDSALLAPDQPSLLYALRGLLYFEVEARCAAHDLHSGSYGGNVQNPAMALAQILARLKDEHGHITVPAFYDAVRVLDSFERAEIARIPMSEQQIMAESGASQVFGEPGYNVAERMGARPTLEINGLWSGYTGEGAKTVLPATAHAKISCRLVPHQNPAEIYKSVVEYMQALTPPGVSLSFKVLQEGTRGTLIDRDAPQIQAAARAAQATYGKAPIYVLEGGSIPVVNDFQDVLGKPIALLGFGLSSDNIHAPDEHYPVRCYEKGIEASIRFLTEL